MSQEQSREVEAIIKALNPGAELIPTRHSKVELERVRNTGLFDYDKAERAPGWVREMQGQRVPESEEYGISSFTYRTSKPFDADKLHAFMNDSTNWDGIL